MLGDGYLPAVEIIPQCGTYFDYTAKYQAGASQEICPARVTERQRRIMGEATLRLHRALGTTDQGAVRFSWSYFNTEEETDTAAEAVRTLASEAT